MCYCYPSTRIALVLNNPRRLICLKQRNHLTTEWSIKWLSSVPRDSPSNSTLSSYAKRQGLGWLPGAWGAIEGDCQRNETIILTTLIPECMISAMYLTLNRPRTTSQPRGVGVNVDKYPNFSWSTWHLCQMVKKLLRSDTESLSVG